MSNAPNFKSNTIWTGDNLRVIRGINSNTVDLLYLDPPFNSNRNYSAPVGSKAAGAAFKDMWTLSDIDENEHGELAERSPATYEVIRAAGVVAGKGMKSYLIFMGLRLLEMKRILKPTGSIYLHCDDTAGAYLKMLMDAVFGKENWRNTIVWCYTGPGSPKMRQFNRKHDTIHWYSNGDQWTFNKDDVRIEHVDGGPHAGGFLGELGKSTTEEYGNLGKVPESWWVQSKGNGLAIAARQRKQYTGYPTQKPLALLDRIIRASSNEGDVVFDPFCGCATTLVAAHNLGRQWIGCDLSKLAVKLVNERILEFDSLFVKAINPDGPPNRDDVKGIKHYRDNKHKLFGKQEGLCKGCNEAFPFKFMEVDHILPKSKGGTDAFKNLQVLCSHCNKSKGSKTMAEWNAWRKQKGFSTHE